MNFLKNLLFGIPALMLAGSVVFAGTMLPFILLVLGIGELVWRLS